MLARWQFNALTVLGALALLLALAAAQATRALLDECRAGIGESEKRSLSAPA
jgi:hypothetical protein